MKKPKIERKIVQLGSLKPRAIFQFPGETLDQAINADDGPRLFMVVKEKKDDQVEIMPLSGPAIFLKKDADRPVHKLEVELKVWE